MSPRGESAVQEDLDALTAADLVYRRRRGCGSTWMFKHALIRDAAYTSLPKRSRRRVHARIARTLEERFPEVVRTRPEVLLLHHAAADQKRQAVVYAERAAESALGRPTSGEAAEAEAYVDEALGWLTAIKDEQERAVTELRLNNLLFLALLVRRGQSPDVAAVVQRFQSLIDKVGDAAPASPTSLLAMFTYHHVQSHRREARALAERLLALAERSQDTEQLVWAQQLLGQCLALEGRPAEARRYFERLLTLYIPSAQRGGSFMYGLDARAYAQATLSRTLFLMGEPDRALATAEAAVAWAREIDHPNSLGVALIHLALIHQLGRRREKVAEVVAGALTVLAEEYELWVEQYGGALRCWAEGDLAGVDRHVETLRSAGFLVALPYYSSLAADLQAERRQHEDANARLDRCLQLAGETGEMFYVPELYRLKALSLQALGEHEAAEAEPCLRQAIAIAREHGARMPEARATLALCRMLVQQGPRDEARALLAEICAWPAQHAAMPEMAEARSLLGAIEGA